jgi:3-dehydroquinate synthetase
MGIMRKNHRERLVRLLKRLGLPVRIPREANNPRFYSALAVDKKSDERGTQFVLLKEIGHCIVGVHIPTPMIATLFGRTK